MVNACLQPDLSAVVQHQHVNVGVAMATPHGLAVPNVKDVQARWPRCAGAVLRWRRAALAASRGEHGRAAQYGIGSQRA